jgi:hypothetical protein
VSNGSVADLQDDSEPIKLLAESGELAYLAGEAIDAVDQQQLDPFLSGEVECGLQAGTLQSRAGRLVLERSGDMPFLHRLAVALKALALGAQRGRLVIFVG